MSFLERSKEVASTVGAQARKQAKRAQLELEVKRINSRINREYTAIGKTLYPKLAEGAPGSENPEVQVAIAELKMLNTQLQEKRDEIERVMSADEETGDVEPLALPESRDNLS